MVGPGLRQANQVNKFRLPFVFFPFVQKETAIPFFVDLLINQDLSRERDFLRKGNQN